MQLPNPRRWNALTLGVAMTFMLFCIWMNFPRPASVDTIALVEEYRRTVGVTPQAGSMTIDTGFPFNYHKTMVKSDATLGAQTVANITLVLNVLLCGLSTLAAACLAHRARPANSLQLLLLLASVASILAIGRVMPALMYLFLLRVLFWLPLLLLAVRVIQSLAKTGQNHEIHPSSGGQSLAHNTSTSGTG